MSERFDDLDERHDDQCEGDGGGMLNCSCGPRQQQRVLAELHALRAATPSSGVTEGKVESGDEIDYDGPCRYCGASESEPCRMNCTGPCCSEASGSPEEMLREIFTAQPPAPADDTAEVLAGLREEMRALARHGAETTIDQSWLKWFHGQHVALVEAAQQRLADRGQSGMPDEFEPYLAEAMKRPGFRAAYEAALRDEENTDG